LNESIQRSESCVILDGMVKSLAWTWADPKSTTLLFGKDLKITLSKSDPQPANPLPAGPSPNQTNLAATVVPTAVFISAQWSLSQGERTQSGHLTLKPLSQSAQIAQIAQLQIKLDGKSPRGVRQPIWVILTSSMPDSVPSISREIQVSARWLCPLITIGFLATVYSFLTQAVHSFYSDSGSVPDHLKCPTTIWLRGRAKQVDRS
jgi:hypothetical protein